MMHHETLRQLTHERTERLRREAEAQRLAMQVRGRRQRRPRRLTFRARRQVAA